MSKQSLLLVDGDTRSLRVLEVSLRKAGFSVTPALSVQDALDKLELHAPDLIISETKFPTDLDGFELRRRVRAVPDWAEIPFVFLTAETAIENKIRGLELGVDDYLTKPIYIKEIVTRINILLQKRQRQFFDEKKDGVRFAGRVADMPVVDVIQTIEISRKSGVIQFVGPNERTAAIYFRDGKVIDAEAGTLQGEDAVYRLLTWSDGEFEVVFRTVRRREAIATSSQGLLMEGMRRLDEWSRLLEQLPPVTHRYEIDASELVTRLGEVPDDHNRILRLIDGKRSLLEVIDASDFGDLECLQAISKLYFEGLLVDLDPHDRPHRDTGRPMPLVMLEARTPIEVVASGPINLADLASRAGTELEPEPPVEAPPARISEQTIGDAEVISEETEAAPTPPPGPLLGGYRQSSLRLIDEAVAAAQLIEPSLFEPEAPAPPTPPAVPAPAGAAVARVQLATRPSDPRIANARDLVEKSSVDKPEGRNGERAAAPQSRDKSVPPPIPAASQKPKPPEDEVIQTLDSDDYEGIPTVIEAEDSGVSMDDGPTDPSLRRFVRTVRREDSGLRMIGSLGRDRAEASGELKPPPQPTTPEGESQRELVTIMPRKREAPAAAPPPRPPTPVPPVEPPRPPPPPRVTVEGGVSVARPSQPSLAARALLVMASLLTGATVYVHCSKHENRPAPKVAVTPESARDATVTIDAAQAFVYGPADAHEIAVLVTDAGGARRRDAAVVAEIRDAAVVAVAPRPDAAVVTVARDAAVVAVAPRPDAAVVAVARDATIPAVAAADAGVDRVAAARDLLDQAHAALEDGDAAKALELADQSLAFRKTAHTYLERAKALQRLGRVDDALASVDAAMGIVPDYAQAWDQRGMILWSARRYDEAKQAFQKYLAISPTGKRAEEIQKLLDQPR